MSKVPTTLENLMTLTVPPIQQEVISQDDQFSVFYASYLAKQYLSIIVTKIVLF